MADKKISALTAATTPLDGTEVLPLVQSGATVKVATNDLTVRNIRANATTGILQVTGPTAATTRVVTVPDANFSAARIDAAQSFTGVQTFVVGNTTTLIENGFQTFGGNDFYFAKVTLKDVNNRTTILTSPNPLSTNGQVGTTSNHAFDILTGNTVRMSFHESNGNATLTTGNLVIGTSGKGFTLPGGITWTSGAGSPEGVVTAPVGSLYSRSDGGLLTSLYVKESGAGNTGWVGK